MIHFGLGNLTINHAVDFGFSMFRFFSVLKHIVKLDMV